jgi:acylphosphatase
MKICLRCYVTGRVQGVWYRAYTRDQALRLDITGYARNLPDGRVEVLACGEEDAVTQLRNWLQKGPPRAQVKEVQWESVPVENHSSFTTA